ncbi:hypothetical protein HAX54_051654 [Datura stramonium]|uniref:Uncharacterized protein n=1 Tax=Datura stramonium TaxID=4076 RepID=A0ABS8SYK5_DATST|nr:hypothetical protein [Datura stramonium]
MSNSVWVGLLDEEGNTIGGYDQKKNKGKEKEKVQDANKDSEAQKYSKNEKDNTNESREQERKQKKNKHNKKVKQVYKVTKDNNKPEETPAKRKQDEGKETILITIEESPREESREKGVNTTNVISMDEGKDSDTKDLTPTSPTMSANNNEK